MGYPLNETFATQPPADAWTCLGSLSAEYNPQEQALDLVAAQGQCILRWNEAAHGDFWFEADLELLSDPQSRGHLGLWMSTGSGVEGYRLAHLDGAWSVTRWSGSLGDGTAVSAQVRAGARPQAGLPGLAPAVAVGERLTLRCEVITGAADTTGLPWARLTQWWANGVLMFQVGDATYRGKLIPGVFVYGATVRLHALRGATPSGLPSLALQPGVNAPGMGPNPGPPLPGGGIALGSAGASIGVHAPTQTSRLHSPASDRWSARGGYSAQLPALTSQRHNIHFSGAGFIAGTVKEKGPPEQPLVRRVQLLHENTRLLVAETWSDALGNYRFDLLDPQQSYTVLSYDHQQFYRAVVADGLRPELPSKAGSPSS